MVITAADLLRLGVTVGMALFAYGRLANPLRFLFPGRVRHRELPDLEAVQGTLAEALRREGFEYLGGRQETLFGLHRHVAQVYAHENGRVVDLPLTGRMAGGYIMTWYEDGRCALTRAGTGRDVELDRYRSRAVGPGRSLQDLLERHAEQEAGLSLGQEPVGVADLASRIRLAREWYREHGRAELIIPAVAEGLLVAGMAAVAIYLWTL